MGLSTLLFFVYTFCFLNMIGGLEGKRLLRSYNQGGIIMRNFVTAATIVAALSLIGCGDKEDDTAEDTAVEDTAVEEADESAEETE